ncbi:MAG: RagB/SusD family nutrient uptake outer membrane protein [Mangrovibacterium sp.]
MKNITKYLLIFLILSAIFSCHDLDISPVQILQDDVVFGSKDQINTYLYNLYFKLPIEDFHYKIDRDQPFREDWTHKSTDWNVMNYHGTGITVMPGYWPYDDIRRVNHFIARLNEVVKQNPAFTANQKNQWKGEAYFIRAYFYFALVKRKGGVPIVDHVQQYTSGDVASLQVPRNTEEECWDFISNDLDSAIILMAEASPEKGRANKYVAAALKSRAMLYAGSIANDEETYNSDIYKHLVGLPKSKADDYFRQSYNAAKLLEGHYSLYKKHSDPEKNFVELFLDSDSPENIFVKYFYEPRIDAGKTAHNLDALICPKPMIGDGPSGTYPSINALELFGPIKTTDEDGSLHPVDNPREFFREFNRFDPRTYATFYFPGDELRGKIINVQKGIFPNYTGNPGTDEFITGGGSSATTIWHAPDGKNYEINGNCGFDIDGGTQSGIFQRKYVDYDRDIKDVRLNNMFQSWIEMRYAEVLLNRAEAAFELDMKTEAFGQYKEIRERAGATINFDATTLTIDEIRMERRRELMYESHTWWDLRRWRTFDKEFDNKPLHALYPFWVYNGDAKYKGKLIFILRNEFGNGKMTFDKKYYYEQIPNGELDKNPNLYPQNPGY